MVSDKTKEILFGILKDFVNVRTVITLGAFMSAYVLCWQGKPVPELVIRIIDLLLGYWFGEKVAKATIQNGVPK